MKKHLFIAAIILASSSAYSQSIITDRNNESVFTFYKAGALSTNVATGDGGIKVVYTYPIKSVIYFKDKGGAIKDGENQFERAIDDYNVRKSHGLSFGASLSTSNKTFLMTDLNKYRPAFKIEIGYVRTVDTIDKLFDNGLNTYTFSIHGWAKLDNIRMHDTSILIEKDRHPLSSGLKFDMSFFPKRYAIISLGINAQYTWNKDQLAEYQHGPAAFNNGVIITNGDPAGYFGKYQELGQIRGYLATPIVIGTLFRNTSLAKDKKDFFISHMAVTPFVSHYVNQNSLPLTRYGASLNYFSSNFSKKKGNFYNYAEAFGVGVDWQHDYKQPVSTRWYAFGTLNFTHSKKGAKAKTTRDNTIR